MLDIQHGFQRPFPPETFHQYAANKTRGLQREITNSPHRSLFDDQQLQSYTEKYTLEPIKALWNQKKVTQFSRMVAVETLNPNLLIRGAGYMTGQSVEQEFLKYEIPCSGNIDLFWFVPRMSILESMPRNVIIENNSISFEVIFRQHDTVTMKREIEFYTSCIDQHINHLNNDIHHYNSQLKTSINHFQNEKIQKRNKVAEIFDELGITIHTDSDKQPIITPNRTKTQADADYLYVGLSYGGQDIQSATILNNYLLEKGVRTWFYPINGKAGEKLHRMMSEMISEVDRVILLCSESALYQTGVLNELEITLEREANEGGSSILIPVTIDDHVFKDWAPEKKDLAKRVRSRNIFKIDFNNFSSNEMQLENILNVLKIKT